MATQFVVEHAGCPSCAERVGGALAAVGVVEAIAVDEQADEATVRLAHDGDFSERAANEMLSAASSGSGHEYRVKPGSWRPDA